MNKPFSALFIILFSQGFGLEKALAATEGQSETVEIAYPIDYARPYKERRRTNGGNFGVQWEQFTPSKWESLNYESDATSAVFYEDIFGSTPINLISVEGGYKRNFAAGSINLLIGFGSGQQSVDFYGEQHNITVTKYYAKGMFILDNMFPEPMIAPYASGSVFRMSITENITETDFGGTYTTGFGFSYAFGALIQLNWLEQDVASRSLSELGLENTFLDLFMTQHFKTQSTSDPSLATSMSYGAGFRLEF